MKLISLVSILISTAALAGGTGGINPPAREKLLQELMVAEPGFGGLFDDNGELGLGLKGNLTPELTITRSRVLGLPMISESDFVTIAAQKGNLTVESIPTDLTVDTNTLNPTTLRASYKVFDGDTLGSLTLKDRKALIRAGEKIPVDTVQAPIAQ